MKYTSTVIDRLKYTVTLSTVRLERDDEEKELTWQEIEDMEQAFLEFMPEVRRELTRLIKVYEYIATTRKKWSLSDTLRVIEILHISYSEYNKKHSLGELQR